MHLHLNLILFLLNLIEEFQEFEKFLVTNNFLVLILKLMYIFYIMNFSYNRNKYVANKLGELNGDKVLDIGCRDQVFEKYIKGIFEYTGIDYNPNFSHQENNQPKLINHNLELGLPDGKQYDVINALDVLEHLENIHQLFGELFVKSNKKIIIALPNMGYYKFRLKFLFQGEISGKYIFHKKKVYDRHRWIPNYPTILNFIKENKPDGWVQKKYNFIADRKKNFITYFLEKFLSKFLPGLFVYEVIFIFEKK